MDAVLAIMVLRTPWQDLPSLDHAPGLLEALGLNMSRLAAMFLLGYEDAVGFETGIDEPEDFFTKLLGQPAARDVAEHADWGVRWPSSLYTVLFGCQIEVRVIEGMSSLLLGETLLAFVESFLATSGMAKGQLSARGELYVEVVARDNAKQPFEYELVEDDAGEVKIVVAHPRGPVEVVDETYIRRMMELLAQVLGQLWMPLRMEAFEALLAEDRAQDRASLTAQLPVVYGGVLGQGAKVQAKDWMALGAESMALRRSVPWRPTAFYFPGDAKDGADGASRDRPTSGIDAGRHRDTKVLSVLNLPLWDASRWKGLAYTFARGPDDVPEIHFLFEDIEAGRKIFRGWLRRFGAVDRDETIGLTLVTGVDHEHPDRYRLAVSYRNADVLDARVQFLGFPVRFHEMSPRDSRNLDQFLERYRRLGRYRIAPMERPAADYVVQTGRPGISIEKRVLKIVPAWKIGPDDFMRAALRGVTSPVVPNGEEDPPFYRPMTGAPAGLDDSS